ncbi:hypothetical protein EDB81DRAFT_932869 [Dactylonectria macrodidyma]|uniref:Uncharacterized protein n=1 Tax=Dactylonectria macrodidyma TaxID=307937 RepID=A0A9P9EZR6_9HYPO|nr:hypothetical protein EDB81DRAFT_932869 [Dactylonectria macrodidyma]
MQPQGILPSELVTCHPVWCPPPNVHAPKPFPLRFPHVRSRETSLWDALRDIDEINDRTLQERILPLCREMEAAYHYEDGQKRVHGMPVELVRKFGEISIRLLRRVWDMHLAYTTTPHVPGYEPGYGGDLGPGFFDSSFNATLRDVVMKRLHYADDVKAAQHTEGPYETDVLAQHLNDQHERTVEEHRVLAALYEEVGKEYPNIVTVKQQDVLKENPALSMRRCSETVDTFYRIHHEEEYDSMRTREKHKHVLRNVATRALDPEHGWEVRQEESPLESVLSSFCYDIVEMRKYAYGVEGNISDWEEDN